MKICFITNLYPPFVLGGYEILCGQVAQHLAERGHAIEVITSDHGSGESGPGVHRSLRLYQPFDKPAGFMRMARSRTSAYNYRVTEQLLRDISPDIVFIWSLLRLTPGPALAAERAGVPVLYTFNDENIAGFLPEPFSLNPKQLVKWLLDATVHRRSTTGNLALAHTTCISRLLKDNLLSRGLPITSSAVIYQGIPIAAFPEKRDPPEVHDPVRLLYCGQLHRYKGVHTILEALSIIDHDNPGLRYSLSIAGEGNPEYTGELKAAAGKLSGEIRFLGRVAHDRMSSVYRENDIFIFPSIWEEPFGLTHLEAMASGLPVVSTANGGQGEFLTDKTNALTFEPGSSAGLAEALQQVSSNRDLYARLRKEGRSTVERQFTFRRYIDELEQALKGTLGQS